MSLKRILITGANKGIGLATVEAVLAHDASTVVLLGSRNADRGTAARDALVAKQGDWAARIETVTIDVGSDASVAEAAAAVKAKHGEKALAAVVNNAGVNLGSPDVAETVNVNTLGPKRVVDAFLPLLQEDGRIVNVSSASGPMFIAKCSDERKAQLTSKDVTWAQIEAVIAEATKINDAKGDFGAAGLGDGNAYGLSKACLNAYTLLLAREHPKLTINACTPGFIETDLTRPFAESRGITPAEMGMKSPGEGTKATLHCLFGDIGASGHYFGSDAVRSPLHKYRGPGDPPYTGE